MNREQIIDIWTKANGWSIKEFNVTITELERFAILVAAAERERLADKFMQIHKSQQHSNNYWHFAARKIKEQA